MQKTVFFTIICFFFISVNVPALYIPDAGFESNKEIDIKYPVVLVHGIGRNDSKTKNMQPWGRIPEVLNEYGIKVFFGNTDAWGNILSNAEILKTTIDTVLEQTGCEKVNIIAHSKGGIDSRYCIWKYNYGNKVASLTMVSTPHQGSEIADLFFNTKIIHTKPIKKRLQVIGKLFGDSNPDMYHVNYELTTENMMEFNANVIKDNRVYYQSVYSVMNDPADDPLFSHSYIHIKNISGENDGLVSEKSANWGSNAVKIPVSISHEQIIDHGGKKRADVEVPNIYLGIVMELSEKGF